MPEGMCKQDADHRVACNSGCAPIPAEKVPHAAPENDRPTMLLLDSREGTGCSLLKRAKNAADAGATGALIVLSAGVAEENMTAQIDPTMDDLFSIRNTNIPVGTVSIDQGVHTARTLLCL